jgi:hypothetical protein
MHDARAVSRPDAIDAPRSPSATLHWLERAAAAFLVATAAYVTFVTLRLIVRARIRVPYWDQWMELLPRDFFRRPFSQHNEHRIFVGRLVFALDMWVGSGRGVLSLAVVVIALAGTAALLALGARQAGAPHRIALAALALGLTALLSAYTWESLLWPFNASYVDVCPFAVAAFVALGSRRNGTRALLEVVVLAALAAYSIACGLVVAPLLVVIAVLTGRARRDVVLLVLSAVALLIAYAVGYENPEAHAGPLEALRHPMAIARYLLLYLGAPLREPFADGMRAATILGVVGLLLWTVCAAHACTRRRQRPEAWTLLGAATFALGWAGMSAVGRVKFGIDQAFAPRYGTAALLFWCALLMDVVCVFDSPFLASSALVAACVLSGTVASEEEAHAQQGAAAYSNLRDAETALVTGGLDRASIDRITPLTYLVRQDLPELQSKHLNVFSEPWARWLGEPLTRHVPRRDDRSCLGYLDHVRAVRGYFGPAFRVDGWAFSRAEHAAVTHVAIVDREGVVVGLALGGYPRSDVSPEYPEVRDPNTGFVGHIGELGTKEGRVSAYAILADGRTACALDRSIHLNVARARELAAN